VFTSLLSHSISVFTSLLSYSFSVHPILLNVITIISANRPIQVVRNINYESSHYAIFPSLPLTSLLITQSPPQNPLSYLPNLCSSLNVRDQVSRPYKTTGKTGITNFAVEWIAHSVHPGFKFWLTNIYPEVISSVTQSLEADSGRVTRTVQQHFFQRNRKLFIH
jgi:hypothetical protein